MTPQLAEAWRAALGDTYDPAPEFATRTEDIEETELARVDALFHRQFGADETAWPVKVRRVYVTTITTIREQFETRRAVTL